MNLIIPVGELPGVKALLWGVLVWGVVCCLFGDRVLSSDLDLGFLGVLKISCSFWVAKLFLGNGENSGAFLSGREGVSSRGKLV